MQSTIKDAVLLESLNNSFKYLNNITYILIHYFYTVHIFKKYK